MGPDCDALEPPRPARRALRSALAKPSDSRRSLKFCAQGHIRVHMRGSTCDRPAQLFSYLKEVVGSSPGWVRSCHFLRTHVYKLPRPLQTAHSLPTLDTAPGPLRASHWSTDLTVSERWRRSKSAKSSSQGTDHHGHPDVGAWCSFPGFSCGLPVFWLIIPDGRPPPTAA